MMRGKTLKLKIYNYNDDEDEEYKAKFANKVYENTASVVS